MAASRNILTSATVILFVSVLIPSVFSIKCYQCNSFENSECEHLVHSNTTTSPYLHECQPPFPLDKPMFCRKIIQNIVAFGVEQKRVIRKCSYEPSEKECYYFEDEDHREVACQCFTDACNRGGRGIVSASLWRTLILPLATVLGCKAVAKFI